MEQSIHVLFTLKVNKIIICKFAVDSLSIGDGREICIFIFQLATKESSLIASFSELALVQSVGNKWKSTKVDPEFLKN